MQMPKRLPFSSHETQHFLCRFTEIIFSILYLGVRMYLSELKIAWVTIFAWIIDEYCHGKSPAFSKQSWQTGLIPIPTICLVPERGLTIQ